MRILKYLSFYLFIIDGLLCCKKVDSLPNQNVANKTVLVYMAANNNLQDDAINCINKMESSANNLNGNLIVFIKTNSNNSCLLKIKYDKTNRIVSDTLKKYGSNNSSDPVFLKEVISDSRTLFPAKSYGLIMWSHGTSWFPASNNTNMITTESFGSDEGAEIDIKALKIALPNDLDYILFDACSMASLEVIYELRNNSKYILASPSEVLSTSYPYDIITPHLFGDTAELKIVAQQFVDYYKSLQGAYSSATVSLINCKELDKLAFLTKKLLDSKKPKNDFNRNIVQRLDFNAKTPVKAYVRIARLDRKSVV